MDNFKKFTIGVIVNASKDVVWDMAFNRFGEVNNFNPLIEGSHQTAGVAGEVGCERSCSLDSKTSILEKIISAKANDSFEVEVIGGGLPMMDKMIAVFELSSEGQNKTKVNVTMRYTTKPKIMGSVIKGQMSKNFMKVLVGLKYHLETGEMVTKSNIKHILKEYKELSESAAFGQKQSVAA